MQDHPLVMPCGELASLAEHLAWRGSMVVLLNEIHGLVMEEEKGSMEAGEHQVLIVARVGNDGGAVLAAGQVFEEATALDLEFGCVAPLHALIQRTIFARPPAIDGVKVEGRRTGVGRFLRRVGSPSREVKSKVMS